MVLVLQVAPLAVSAVSAKRDRSREHAHSRRDRGRQLKLADGMGEHALAR